MSAQIFNAITGMIPISAQMKGIITMTNGVFLSDHCNNPIEKMVNGQGAVPKMGYLG